jgi:hypothetical protein
MVIGVMALLVGLAVYTAYAFAVTFKNAVEISQKLRHPFGR